MKIKKTPNIDISIFKVFCNVNNIRKKNMEILDVLNEYGEFTGKTATREEFRT